MTDQNSDPVDASPLDTKGHIRKAWKFWCIWFLSILYIGSVALSFIFLISMGAHEDPHWRAIMVPSVLGAVSFTIAVFVVLPALAAGRLMATAIVSDCRLSVSRLIPVTMIVAVPFTAFEVLNIITPSFASKEHPSIILMKMFGMLSFFAYPVVCFLLALSGYFAGRIWLPRADKARARIRRWGVAGMATCTASLILVGAAILVAIPRLPTLNEVRGTGWRTSSSCLKQFGIIQKMYAHENQDACVAIAPFENAWTPDLRPLLEEYVSCPEILVNPHAARAIRRRDRGRLAELLDETPVDWSQMAQLVSEHYVYLGWAVRTEEEALALAHARAQLAPGDYDKDIQTPDGTIYRLREDIEELFGADTDDRQARARVQATIPVMFDNINTIGRNREPRGVSVLYMDGHVEFRSLDKGEFPATEAIAEAFCAPAE